MTPPPHDALVKAIFGTPDTMAEVLEMALPGSLAELLDLTTLTRVAGMLPEARATGAGHTDLLFSVQSRTPERVPIYALVEFLLKPDDLAAFRLLEHEVAIFDSWRARGRDRLPPVLPVILYLGPREWRVPREFAECYDCAEDDPILDSALNFELIVDDLSKLSEDRLRSRRLGPAAKLAFLIMRYVGDRNLMNHLDRWEALWNAAAIARGGAGALDVMARYLIDASPYADRERLLGLIPRNAAS
jgi:hypothetical protein